jgi:hypothetical protein
MLRLLIGCTLLYPFILHPMMKTIQKNSREIVQRKKKQEQPLLALQHHGFIKKILVIKEFAEQIKLNIKQPLEEIINYNICLDNRKFEQTFHHIASWKDFQIPLSCHYALNEKQLHILGAYFRYIPQNYTFEGCYAMRYYLNSQQEYEQFIKIPRILREYLIYLPESHRKHATKKNREQGYILNPNKTLLIDLSPKSPKEKPILPEESRKRAKSL